MWVLPKGGLAVRELHRAIKGYAKLKGNSSRMEKLTLTEFADDATLRLPLIYLMDCSVNDCGSIIMPILQVQVILILFQRLSFLSCLLIGIGANYMNPATLTGLGFCHVCCFSRLSIHHISN